jgi:hypothetical protein
MESWNWGESNPPIDAVKITYKIVLENAWMGYKSRFNLPYTLPSYGIVNMTILDFVEDMNFRFISSNYASGFNNSNYEVILAQYMKDANINLNNPVTSQSGVNKYFKMVDSFLGSCQPCRAYITAIKSGWRFTPEIKKALMKDYFIDWSPVLDQDTNPWKYRTYFIYGNENLMSSFDEMMSYYGSKFKKDQIGDSNFFDFQKIQVTSSYR